MALSMALNGQVLVLILVFFSLTISRTTCLSEDDSRLKVSEVANSDHAESGDFNRDEIVNKDIDNGDGNIVFNDGYEEVKEKLREIFTHEIHPQGVEDDVEHDFSQRIPQGDQISFLNDIELSKRYKLEEHSRTREILVQDNILDFAEEQALRAGQPRSLKTGNREQESFSHAVRHAGHEDTKHYMNEWVVHLTGGSELAAAVAKDLGYDFLGEVGNFRDVYRLVKRDHPSVTKRAAPSLTHQLNVHAEVKWAEQQFAKERSKRAVVPDMHLINNDNYDPYAPLIREKRVKREEELERELMGERDQRVEIEDMEKREEKNYHSVNRRSAMAAEALKMEDLFNDELWVHQWYLFDTRTRGDLPKLDLQVVPVWKAGITGRGVRVNVLDDGLEWIHKDIAANYDSEISYDFNDNDDDPSPRYDEHLTNSHGTRCAGEIAMIPNNRKCGVGIAYGASVGGVRMLDGPVSDAVEGASLGWALNKVDIITCSWGPTDDGRRVEGPGRLAQMAIEKGIAEGRGGKGLVYVWAAGNGGYAGDDCNCDGYTSSIYTLSISSASETGQFPWYGERCASTLAAAYSSGAYTDQKISTTDLHNTCTDKFSGTSAAAPLAAGILALALEVNPELTWRDMQHAVVWSSEWAPLGHNNGWRTNARGLKYNPRFGFGLLSADGLVQTVRNWTLVPEKVVCRMRPTSRSSNRLRTGETVTMEFQGAGCESTRMEIQSLEHVQVMTTLNYTRRGALSVMIESPAGTKTRLLNERKEDDSDKGFHRWALMSVHTWGEDPRGLWLLHITDNSTGDENGTIGELELVLHGTKDIPEHFKTQRTYRIPFEENTRDVEDDVDLKSDEGLTLDRLKTMSWEQLVDLISHRTQSSLSESDIRMLMKENRLEGALNNIRSVDDEENISRAIEESDWQLIVNELYSRK